MSGNTQNLLKQSVLNEFHPDFKNGDTVDPKDFLSGNEVSTPKLHSFLDQIYQQRDEQAAANSDSYYSIYLKSFPDSPENSERMMLTFQPDKPQLLTIALPWDHELTSEESQFVRQVIHYNLEHGKQTYIRENAYVPGERMPASILRLATIDFLVDETGTATPTIELQYVKSYTPGDKDTNSDGLLDGKIERDMDLSSYNMTEELNTYVVPKIESLTEFLNKAGIDTDKMQGSIQSRDKAGNLEAEVGKFEVVDVDHWVSVKPSQSETDIANNTEHQLAPR